MKVFRKVFQYGAHQVTLETGGIARQATSAVMVRMQDTVVLVTVVGKRSASTADFFPLTVNYQERMYAGGRIPGGFLKREGRPGDHETLIARLIDRPIRPLFPEGFRHEVQVVATVMSLDPEVTPDIPAMIGASAALMLSGIPFEGPIGAARVGYIDGQYVLNPSDSQLLNSSLDLVVAGTDKAVLMVESEAKELSEEVMLNAVVFGHQQQQLAIQAIKELAKAAGKPQWEFTPVLPDANLVAQIQTQVGESLKAAYQIREKQDRQEKIEAIKTGLVQALVTGLEGAPSEKPVMEIFSNIEYRHVRDTVLNGELRIDGRDTKTVRPIRVETGLLPRVHGSAMFTRGETQAIVATTLGTDREAQILDLMSGEERGRFMLHYNFPPYCVGETGMMGSPKRREIGHGNLAKRALTALLPSDADFPYVLRVVSEITESNGSSSMATVCGASLALMDAGVPLKAPVAGIAMGLIKEADRFAVLTDILGDEDHLGDMDFKVAGTVEGITALQMDIKINGITQEIMQVALNQAREGRLHILAIMSQVLDAPKEMSQHAPRMTVLKIHPEKVKEVIGKGGATIKGIIEKTGVSIDIEDDGSVKIFSSDGEASKAAVAMIEAIIATAEIGAIYEGKVVRLADFGAFVNVLPGKDGLVHISQIQEARVEKVTDVLSEGDIVRVKVLDIDRQGRIKLTMRDLDAEPTAAPATDAQVTE